MSVTGILILSLVLCLSLVFVLYKYFENKDKDILKNHEKAIYNGKDTYPPLSTINNIGFGFWGDYRRDLNGSSVKYVFFSILIPLIPISCCRATKGLTIDLGRQGYAHKTETDYTIYGTEKWNFLEVLYIYLKTISIILAIVVFCFIF